MNIEELFPNPWMEAADLAGNDVAFTIQRFSIEELKHPGSTKTDNKGVLWFGDVTKGFVLGPKIHKRVLVHNFGKETDNWIGKRVVLYESRDKYQRDMVACMRIRCDADKPETMKSFICNNRYYMSDHASWIKTNPKPYPKATPAASPRSPEPEKELELALDIVKESPDVPALTELWKTLSKRNWSKEQLTKLIASMAARKKAIEPKDVEAAQ